MVALEQKYQFLQLKETLGQMTIYSIHFFYPVSVLLKQTIRILRATYF